MRKFAFALLLAWPGLANAEDCPDLGLESAYLTQFFCDQAAGIGAQTGSDRSSWPDGFPPPDDATKQPWRQFEVFDEAYRVDPRKTLELIDRIKSAGGLIEQ